MYIEELNMNKKICFISNDPAFLGGVSLYTKHLVDILKSKNKDLEITWIYRGKENKNFNKEGVNYIELKVQEIPFLEEIFFNKKIKRFLEKNYFDIINSHALGGYWMKSYKKKKGQRITHTYHGSTYYFYKNHLGRRNFLKKLLAFFLLLYGFVIEKPAIKKADKIICVSEKVKKQIEKLYGKKENIAVIRTGVDLKKFKKRNKEQTRKKFGLNRNKIYGLYVGKGGFWTKGLDRVIKISKEIHNINKDYLLIVAGADYQKTKHLLNEKFIIYMDEVKREQVPYYYNMSDIFFCLSRYEGGAPTLVVSEGMASECLVVCSKDSEQEIINNGKNGVIISSFEDESAKKIISILQNKKKLNKIKRESLKTIKKYSLENWGKEIVKELCAPYYLKGG